MIRFLQTLNDQNFRPMGKDKLLLKNAKEKSFSIKVMYKSFGTSLVVEFSYRLVWNPVVPPKIGVFAWEAVWGKVLTLDQLKCCGLNLVNRCFMCEEEEETRDHLSIHYKCAKMLWDLFLSIVWISWVFPQSVFHTLLAWQGAVMGKKRKKFWLAAPLCLFRNLWGIRNRLVFENEIYSSQRIKANFVSNLWTWANLYSDANSHVVLDFLT